MAIAHKAPVPRFVTDTLGIVFGKGHLKAEAGSIGGKPLEGFGFLKRRTQVGCWHVAIADIYDIACVMFAIARGALTAARSAATCPR